MSAGVDIREVTMRNPLRSIASGLAGAVLLGAAGFIITHIAVADWKSQFEVHDHALASASVQAAQRCIEHPIERALVQRFRIDELTPEQASSAHIGIGGNTAAGSAAALLPHDGAQGEFMQTHRARVSAYTLFAIPIFTVSVTGSAPDLPGNCRRM